MESGSPLLVFTGQRKDIGTGSDSPRDFFRARENSLFSLICPYCHQPCKTKSSSVEFSGAIGWQDDNCSWCERCGWWSFQADQDDLNGQAYFLSSRAILQEFLVSSEDVPLKPLRDYVLSRPEKMRLINPAKFEELVGDVYSELLGYKVEHCSYGRPDLGIDVVIVNTESGDKIAIQVKRYKNPIELGTIHQFFGAMIDGGHRKGVFVTSSKYRRGAYQAASRLSSKGMLTIDLVDGRRFLDFIGILNSNKQPIDERSCPYWGSVGYMSRGPGCAEVLGGCF